MRYSDQMGRTVHLTKPAKRIISLVPSQTEFLYDIGIEPIAQTIFCIHPQDSFKQSAKIGGTKKLQINKIRALQPDLIIGNKEENLKEEIEILASEFPVWMSDIYTLDDAYEMMYTVGKMTDKLNEAQTIINKTQQQFGTLIKAPAKKVIYMIWNDPYMAVGRSTFIDEMIRTIGLDNAITEERYPQLNKEDIDELRPDLIFLSTEPFPFKESHLKNIEREFPYAKVILVDGEMFSWYGSRLIKAPTYFNSLLQQITD